MTDQLDNWLDRFWDHLAVERGLSRNTLEAYARDLQGYRAFLSEHGVSRVEDS